MKEWVGRRPGENGVVGGRKGPNKCESASERCLLHAWRVMGRSAPPSGVGSRGKGRGGHMLVGKGKKENSHSTNLR